jgi:cytochrome c-type biogenesis protein CcmE
MTRKQRRLMFIGVGLTLGGGAVGLALYAMSATVTFFKTPAEIAALVIKEGEPAQRYRLGGCVAMGSVKKDGITTIFDIVDGAKQPITVRFSDHLPDLFREGQGVVAEGTLGADRIFTATTVLAKHDEKYMPPEVASSLKKQGVQSAQAAAPGAGKPGDAMASVCQMLTSQ